MKIKVFDFIITGSMLKIASHLTTIRSGSPSGHRQAVQAAIVRQSKRPSSGSPSSHYSTSSKPPTQAKKYQPQIINNIKKYQIL